MKLEPSRSVPIFAALIIVGLFLAYAGYGSLNAYLNPPSVESTTELGGMLLGWSNSTTLRNGSPSLALNNTWVSLTVDTIGNKVTLQFEFQSRYAVTHQFAMILPFPTGNLTVLNSAAVGGTVTFARTQNLSESSSLVQFTWASIHNYTDWFSGVVALVVKTAGNLVSSKGGEDELYLPIGVYPSAEVVKQAVGIVPAGLSFPRNDSDFAVSFAQISVVIPPNARLEQLIPSFADVQKTANSEIVNIQGLFGTSSVTVDYQDISVAGAYSNDLLFGIILALSGTVVIATGIGAPLYLRRRQEGAEFDLAALEESSRRLASVMFMDIVGYSGIAHRDEGTAMRTLREQRSLVRPLLLRHTGRQIKTIGDGVLVEFASALEAVNCAYDIQNALHESNLLKPTDGTILMRIGIHLGDVMHTRDDVFGDAVNVASRVEPLAPRGGVAFTRQVCEEVKNKVKFPILELGKYQLKNIEGEYELFRVVFSWEPADAPAQPKEAGPPK